MCVATGEGLSALLQGRCQSCRERDASRCLKRVQNTAANRSLHRLTLIWRTSPKSFLTRLVITVQTRPSKVVNRVLLMETTLAEAEVANAALASRPARAKVRVFFMMPLPVISRPAGCVLSLEQVHHGASHRGAVCAGTQPGALRSCVSTSRSRPPREPTLDGRP